MQVCHKHGVCSCPVMSSPYPENIPTAQILPALILLATTTKKCHHSYVLCLSPFWFTVPASVTESYISTHPSAIIVLVYLHRVLLIPPSELMMLKWLILL